MTMDPIAEKLDSSWPKVIRTIDERIKDGTLLLNGWENQLNEVRFYLDLEDHE